MEKTFVALLRGINVSGVNKLPMKALVELADSMPGLAHCRTYIQSGNLVFEAETGAVERFEPRLQEAIAARFGFSPPVMLHDADEWETILAENPFSAEGDAAPKTVHVLLLSARPSAAAIAALESRDFGLERWHIGTLAVYLHLPDGMGRSKLGTSIEKILGVPVTARNWSSVKAISEMMREKPR